MHLHFVRMLKKKTVADGGVGLARHFEAETDTEVFRMGVFYCETVRVVQQIGFPLVEGAIVMKYLIVVAFCPKGGFA